MNDFMEPIKEVFSHMLSIKRNPKGVVSPIGKRSCYHVNYQNAINEPNYDLYVFVTSENAPSDDFLAWATNCHQDSGSFRPNMG